MLDITGCDCDIEKAKKIKEFVNSQVSDDLLQLVLFSTKPGWFNVGLWAL